MDLQSLYTQTSEILNRVKPSWAEAQDIAALFNIHNTLWPNIKEYGLTCPSCRSRVYNRILKWHADYTQQLQQAKADETIKEDTATSKQKLPRPSGRGKNRNLQSPQ